MNKLNFYQFVRSLLPKCSSDAKIFSSDVYKESTQARKYQADGLQFGRSMIEMLGVLAIIGVLSVGAIAGYQKAMFKYKLNKQTQQINTVINAVIKHLHSFEDVSRTLSNSENHTVTLIKLGEISKEMIKPNNYTYIYDTFNSSIDFQIYPFDKKQSIVHIRPDLTTKSWHNLEICKNILHTLRENANDIHSVIFVSNYNQETQKSNTILGNKVCVENCLKDITLEQIHEICTNHYNQETSWIDVWFRW